jgi:outer membrane protein assembly factor BamE (lipoprotein component of BamABCDE complex)
MEIFGIPLFIIFLIVIRAWSVWSDYSDQQQKEKEQIAKRWDAIAPGMTKKEVLRRLGKPNRLVEVGA